MNISKRIRTASVSLATIACVAVLSQGADAQATSDAAPDTTASSTTASNAASDGDIVVTAQRRSESLQAVPIAITAIPQTQLTNLNISQINDIQIVTPGLVLDSGYGYPQTYIRGIGQQSPNTGLEGPVAFYLDGAYQERTFGTLSDLFDISSVQVLKGAQGTLYGRNATGGAILVTTADPTDEASLHLGLEYGRFNRVVGEVIANAPISNTLAVRISLREAHDGGYITNLFDGSKLGNRKSYIARGKIKWTPAADFTAVLGLEYDRRTEGSAPQQLRSGAPLCLVCSLFPGVDAVSGFYDTNQDQFTPLQQRTYAANLKLNYDMGSISLQSVTAYRDEQARIVTEQDLTALPLYNFSANPGGKNFTEELQASSNFSGMFNFLAGVSYLHDEGFYDTILSGGFFAGPFAVTGEFPHSYNDVDTTSMAAYGEVYIKPIDRLKITLGGRYTKDRRTVLIERNAATFTGPGAPAAGTDAQGLVISTKQSFKAFTPRVVVAYDLDTVNLYASWNRGFKAGGVGTPLFALGTFVNPEKVDYFEGGAKFVSDDRRVRLNAATFYYKHRDIQVQFVDIAAGGATVANAAGARGYGAELDGSFSPNDWLSIFGNAAYLNAKYTSYPSASVNLVDPVTGGLVGGAEDLSGFVREHAPKWTASLGFNVKAPVGRDWVGELNGVAKYTTKYFFNAGGAGPLRQSLEPKYTIVNFTGKVGPENGHYSIGFYLNNAFNEKYFNYRNTQAPFGYFDQVAAPRTYGVRLTADF